MKTALLAQQFAYFRQTGHVRLEDFPTDFEEIRKVAEKASSPRDLWRDAPFLKKLILRSFGPIALELTKQRALRVGCDLWVQGKLDAEKLEDLFCFQGCACIFFLSEDGGLDIFDSLSEDPLPEAGYLVLFTLENAVLIDNPKDPFVAQTRSLGYGYGDRLKNEFHPLIAPK